MDVRLLVRSLVFSGLFLSARATADWKAGNPDVATAAKDKRIAGALAAVNAIDRAAVSGNHVSFTSLLADDLAVNNPQNGVSVRGATGQRRAAGQISYSRYDRVVDYSGRRGDLVLLMGEEIVLPKGSDASSTRNASPLY